MYSAYAGTADQCQDGGVLIWYCLEYGAAKA